MAPEPQTLVCTGAGRKPHAPCPERTVRLEEPPAGRQGSSPAPDAGTASPRRKAPVEVGIMPAPGRANPPADGRNGPCQGKYRWDAPPEGSTRPPCDLQFASAHAGTCIGSVTHGAAHTREAHRIRGRPSAVTGQYTTCPTSQPSGWDPRHPARDTGHAAQAHGTHEVTYNARHLP